LSRADILAPAIDLASGGFPAYPDLIEAIEGTAELATKEIGPDAGFLRVYRPDGHGWRPGELIRLPALAATLRRLADDGFDTFYAGDLAERQARALAAAGSAITAADFEAHQSTWTNTIATMYRGVRVTSHPPNSSGLVALELLNILEQFEPPGASAFAAGRGADARWAHLGIEASKLAMADRDAHLTDPEFQVMPINELLDKAYAAELAGRIDPTRAGPAPAATAPRGGGTIYLATVDGEGNAVSLIESNYLGFGSGIVDPDTGVHYQNRGSYFSLDAAHPNVLAAGKRTLHTLLPGMLFRDDDAPWVVAGSMGGDAQPQIHAQLVSALVDGGLDVQAGVSAPRWFVEPAEHFAPPVEVRAEPRFAPGVLEELEAMGHPVTRMKPFDSTLGHCHAIELVAGGPSAEGGSLAAATDPRSEGLPAVR
jgi:oxamate amidohydrolase